VEVSLRPAHRSVVEEVSEALPCSGRLASGVAPEGPTQCETRWRAVLVSFDKQHETLIPNNPDATEEIIIIRTGIVKIGQLIQTKSTASCNKEFICSAEGHTHVGCGNVWRNTIFRQQSQKR
jgi:hypothetical protein